MTSNAITPDEYVSQLPDNRQEIIRKIREILKKNIPEGFEEEMSYGMIGYVVPYSIYPSGYAVKPKVPLPFINLASQKNYISLYHMCISNIPDMLRWFETEYAKHCKTKLDMGKGCIRFKSMDDIPYNLIAELAQKISVNQWIEIYEDVIKKK